jgi:hypothetical protein
LRKESVKTQRINFKPKKYLIFKYFQYKNKMRSFRQCENRCNSNTCKKNERGHRGHRGRVGDKGSDGETGATGSTGAVGNIGSSVSGSTGPTGPTGLSGASLKGPTGNVGTIGPAGGFTGPDGNSGDTGPSVVGNTGSIGPIGANGMLLVIPGTTGPMGPQGASSAAQGYTGNIGASGPTGGSLSPFGVTGTKGPDGPIGRLGNSPAGPAGFGFLAGGTPTNPFQVSNRVFTTVEGTGVDIITFPIPDGNGYQLVFWITAVTKQSNLACGLNAQPNVFSLQSIYIFQNYQGVSSELNNQFNFGNTSCGAPEAAKFVVQASYTGNIFRLNVSYQNISPETMSQVNWAITYLLVETTRS